MFRNERGAVLLEVLIAVVVLVTAGLAFIETAAHAVRAAERLTATEQRLLDEDRLLTAYALLDRRDLERRVGWHLVGPYVVTVRREGFELFHVAVGSPDAAPEFETVLYRRDPRDD